MYKHLYSISSKKRKNDGLLRFYSAFTQFMTQVQKAMEQQSNAVSVPVREIQRFVPLLLADCPPNYLMN